MTPLCCRACVQFTRLERRSHPGSLVGLYMAYRAGEPLPQRPEAQEAACSSGPCLKRQSPSYTDAAPGLSCCGIACLPFPHKLHIHCRQEEEECCGSEECAQRREPPWERCLLSVFYVQNATSLVGCTINS